MPVIDELQRRSVLAKVLATIDDKFMGAEPDTRSMREEHEAQILGADTAEDFEQAMNSMLKKLGTSHTGFFHEGRPRAAGRIAIAATLTKAETADGVRAVWVGLRDIAELDHRRVPLGERTPFRARGYFRTVFGATVIVEVSQVLLSRVH